MTTKMSFALNYEKLVLLSLHRPCNINCFTFSLSSQRTEILRQILAAMGKHSGKWLKTILFGKKSSRFQSSEKLTKRDSGRENVVSTFVDHILYF